MKETELKILIYGNKALRRKAVSVKKVGNEERAILEKMVQIMQASKGIGLAATQLGIDKQLIVVDVGYGLFKLANPKIKNKQGNCVMQEGCLSVPDVAVEVKRAKKIFVECIDEFNRKVYFWADDLFSRAIQHEVDHLRGRLIIDYLGLFKKLEVKKIFNLHKRGRDSKNNVLYSPEI